MIKPQITLNLHPVLEAYCRWIFETPRENKEIAFDRMNDVGKHLFSHIKASELPAKKRPRKDGFNLVTFDVTLAHNCGYQLTNHFLYVDDWAEMKINDFIRTDFNACCRKWFWKGYNFGWTQETIIKAILRGLNLRNNIENYEAIKKNDYRVRKKKEEEQFKMLLETD